MFAVDFEYDDRRLSQYGFIICYFDSNTPENISAGSQITFNKVQRDYGKSYSLVSTSYEECVTASFSICKDPCLYGDDPYISHTELRDLMRWLNRREFLRFQLLGLDDDTYESCYFYASFNVEKVLSFGRLVGLNLTMETNAPFGFGQEQVAKWSFAEAGESKVIYDMSDEIGYLRPDIKITLGSACDLVISNNMFDEQMTLANCTAGEIITIDGKNQIITSSKPLHDIANDFNYTFLKIGNTIYDRANRITVNAPCTMELRYSPIIKEVPG